MQFGHEEPIVVWATGWTPMDPQKPWLRPCPMCGSTALVRHNMICFWIMCNRCGVSTPAYRSAREAADMWNRASRAKSMKYVVVREGEEDD